LDFASVGVDILDSAKDVVTQELAGLPVAQPAGKMFSDGFSSKPFRTGNEDYEFRRDASIRDRQSNCSTARLGRSNS
jgi:hypothetical protein